MRDALKHIDEPEERDKSLLQNLFQYSHKSRILNKKHGDEYEAKWVKLGGTRESYSRAVLEFLINTSDPTSLRTGGRDVFVNSWTGQPPWKEVEAWPRGEYSIWADILKRRLEFVSADELRKRLAADDVTDKEWQRLLVELILADVSGDPGRFRSTASQLAAVAKDLGSDEKSPFVQQLVPLLSRDETVDVAMMLLVHLRVTEREAIQIQNWPMLAMAAQYRLDLSLIHI